MKTNITSFKFCSPSGTYFSKEHIWVRKNEYGLIKIGVDEITLKILGKIFISLVIKPEIYINKDDIIFEMISGAKKIPVTSPVSGWIKFINPFLKNKNITDAYEDDWIFLFQASHFIEEKYALMTESEYKNWIINESNVHKEFFEDSFLSNSLRKLKYD